MRRVALVGGAEATRGGIASSRADEIWTVNWSYRYDWIPRIDRLFEMHRVWLMLNDRPEYVKVRDHWRWLMEHEGYPVYMLKHVPQIPACVEYPLDAVCSDLFGGRLSKAGREFELFGSSFDYMLALAIHEKWDVIELHGMEMGSETEYRYQRETAGLFIGMALARGIRVELPENSILLRAKKYGYEGSQMIFRQDLERILNNMRNKSNEAMARLQHFEGRASEQAKSGDGMIDEKLSEKMQAARDDVLIASANEQLITYLIREIDLEEPDYEFVNPIRKIDAISV